MSVPITPGSGGASVASELIGANQYQQIKIIGGETGSTSVLGVNPDRSVNVSVIGTQTTIITGSIAAAIVSGSIVVAPAANQSVSGTTGSSIIGWVPIQASNTSVITVIQNSSLIAVATGSVITQPSNTSVLTIPTSSTIVVLQATSIVGSYAEDAAHTSGDKGVFSLSVRNDLQASITSNDGDYSPFAVGPTGALIATDAPITRWIQGTGDLRVVQGASVTVIAAQGSSVFTYIREIQVANYGPSSVIVTFGGGLGSILSYTIAPAGGGSNFITRLKTGENSAFTASINGTASVLVSAQGFNAKI